MSKLFFGNESKMSLEHRYYKILSIMRGFYNITRKNYADFLNSESFAAGTDTASCDQSNSDVAAFVSPSAFARFVPILAWIPRYSHTSSVTALAILV